jgi:hypothetical protein
MQRLRPIRIVTAMRVIPLSGDQFVLPIHSDIITPATHIQAVPSRAIKAPLIMPISLTEVMEITKSKSVAPAIPIYRSRIGISSFDSADFVFAAVCMLRTALAMSGSAKTIPAIAPPSTIPIPIGRHRVHRR